METRRGDRASFVNDNERAIHALALGSQSHLRISGIDSGQQRSAEGRRWRGRRWRGGEKGLCEKNFSSRAGRRRDVGSEARVCVRTRAGARRRAMTARGATNPPQLVARRALLLLLILLLPPLLSVAGPERFFCFRLVNALPKTQHLILLPFPLLLSAVSVAAAAAALLPSFFRPLFSVSLG